VWRGLGVRVLRNGRLALHPGCRPAEKDLLPRCGVRPHPEKRWSPYSRSRVAACPFVVCVGNVGRRARHCREEPLGKVQDVDGAGGKGRHSRQGV